MKREKNLETMLVLVLALIVCFWIFKSKYFLTAAVILGAIGLFIPFLAEQIHWAWMKLAHILGFVVSKVLLTVIFFVIVFPLSIMAKMAGKNSVRLKAGGKSYFKDRNYTYPKESLENVW